MLTRSHDGVYFGEEWISMAIMIGMSERRIILIARIVEFCALVGVLAAMIVASVYEPKSGIPLVAVWWMMLLFMAGHWIADHVQHGRPHWTELTWRVLLVAVALALAVASTFFGFSPW